MKNEITKILNRKEFYFTLVFMLVAVFGDYVYICYMFREVELSGVISAYDGTILTNIAGTPFGIVFGFLLPICASIIASTTGLEERKMGMTSCMFTRSIQKKYLFSQGKAIFLMAFSVVFFVLMVSLLLSILTFPIQGFNTMFQADYDGLLNVDKNYMLDYLFRLHPYINIIIFIVLRALFAGLFAWFAYGISFLGNGNKVIVILSPFILLIVITIIMEICKEYVRRISTSENLWIWFNTDILSVNHYGRLEMVIVIGGIIFFLGFFGIMKGCKSEVIL